MAFLLLPMPGRALAVTMLLSLAISLEFFQALAVTTNINQLLSLPSSKPLPSLLSPSIDLNPPLLPLNTTPILATNNGYLFTCSGQSYGYFHHSEVSACLDATESIAAGRERYRFAMRGMPECDDDAYPLPWRWMSRMSILAICS